MDLQAPKGTKDMLPMDAYKWHGPETDLGTRHAGMAKRNF